MADAGEVRTPGCGYPAGFADGDRADEASALHRRRLAYGCLVAITSAGLSAWLGFIVSGNGQTVLDVALVLSFLMKLLWVSSVFWSAAIGFILRRSTRDPISPVLPPFARIRGDEPMLFRTAIVMTIRDEDAKRVFAHMQVVRTSIDATGFGDRFDYFLLSDSMTPKAIAAEHDEMTSLRKSSPGTNLIYRRRDTNIDYKAGNLHDFCQRWGERYEFMAVLDADSVMSGEAILRLVRIMQAAPRLGILQSMIDCVLPPTAIARVFEFGHRHVWHNYILGSVWWQDERCQYRGHNALIRVAAYAAHGRMNDGDGAYNTGRHVMCFDQIEAALLHRAGFEVRELPIGGGSYEGMPSTLVDFLGRYRRWCQGDLINLRLLALPGLRTMDKYHLAGVAQRFLGWPAVVLFVTLAVYAVLAWPPDTPFPKANAAALYASFAVLYLTPRMLGLADAMLAGARRYGGFPRLALGALTELLFNMLFVPVAMVAISWFIIRFLFGYRSSWLPQRRQSYRSPLKETVLALWPQTLLGFGLSAALAVAAPAALPWFAPFLGALVLAIPFGVLTGSRGFSASMERLRICAMPEEIAPPVELVDLGRLDREGNGQ
ncbi:MAG: glucans biosynthesis glucosyltransferase MdoH [Bradyrhizobium sp.]|uniref:glucans biosynthesis glucosyltransferase MdoH n=1 Tax=Bradyrhizobium sp. TaxID=376 RepID=UPI001210323B|nr:glucans biosynthesis glucosyltransferase MdoH [Bradyrhizobium sp.]THD60172.1 MAG: glucans biosynthesis glucosyltransferase MdoH [Bradyrhizobium sp.]